MNTAASCARAPAPSDQPVALLAAREGKDTRFVGDAALREAVVVARPMQQKERGGYGLWSVATAKLTARSSVPHLFLDGHLIPMPRAGVGRRVPVRIDVAKGTT
jgi:hypothetical protein